MAGDPQGPPAFYLITDPFDSLLPKTKTMKTSILNVGWVGLLAMAVCSALAQEAGKPPAATAFTPTRSWEWYLPGPC
jgi:hypothetical protein